MYNKVRLRLVISHYQSERNGKCKTIPNFRLIYAKFGLLSVTHSFALFQHSVTVPRTTQGLFPYKYRLKKSSYFISVFVYDTSYVSAYFEYESVLQRISSSSILDIPTSNIWIRHLSKLMLNKLASVWIKDYKEYNYREVYSVFRIIWLKSTFARKYWKSTAYSLVTMDNRS